jgi:anti-sigma regulatory factor (Ser/Thr protein kinase)
MLYEREHHVAATLQESLLPDPLTEVSGVDLAACYLPGGEGMDVGGDWYDTFQLPDGRLGIMIGDVVGRGAAAAAAMGQLRNAARAYSYEGYGPGAALERLNRMVEWTDKGHFTTMMIGILQPESGVLTYSSAGHPPMLLVASDGATSFVEGARNLPLGVSPEAVFSEEGMQVPRGATVVLYTDGLVERRGESLDIGLARLSEAGRTGPRDLETFVDHLRSSLIADGTVMDDVAILSLRLAAPSVSDSLRLRMPPEAGALRGMRADLRSWLGARGVTDEAVFDVLVACNEACTNAIEHSGTDHRFPIQLDGDLDSEELRITVRDFGRWKESPPSPERGNGSRLMEGLMDSCVVTPTSEGTTVRMRRRLALPPATV